MHNYKKKESFLDDKYYFTDTITGSKILTYKKKRNIKKDNKIKSIEDFNNDFFSFRDKIEHNTSIKEDPVDKIIDLDANKNYDNDIKNIYDDIVKNDYISVNPCKRNAVFDNIIDYTVGGPGLHLTKDEWN